jgi:hypothetical protein
MDAQIAALRQQARAAKSAQDARLVSLHHAAAAALAAPGAGVVREAALAQVSRWEAGRLCSSHYIALWRNILALAPAEAEQAMLQPDGEGPALRQNTPFGFLLRGQP